MYPVSVTSVQGRSCGSISFLQTLQMPTGEPLRCLPGTMRSVALDADRQR